MRPYINLKGKGAWSYLWRDKVKKVFKKIFKKSARQQNKKLIQKL